MRDIGCIACTFLGESKQNRIIRDDGNSTKLKEEEEEEEEKQRQRIRVEDFLRKIRCSHDKAAPETENSGELDLIVPAEKETR